MAVCSHPLYGAHGGLYPRRPRPATLAVALQGGRPHQSGPDAMQHLDDQDPPSPGRTGPEQGHRKPAPTVPEDPRIPEAGGTHQPLAKPARATPRRCAPIQSTKEPPPAVRPLTAGPRGSSAPGNGNRTTVPSDTETATGVQRTGRRPEPKLHTALSSAGGDLP